jgi:hypothetical protein
MHLASRVIDDQWSKIKSGTVFTTYCAYSKVTKKNKLDCRILLGWKGCQGPTL